MRQDLRPAWRCSKIDQSGVKLSWNYVMKLGSRLWEDGSNIVFVELIDGECGLVVGR